MDSIECPECGINNHNAQQYCGNCGVILRPLDTERHGHFKSGFELSQMEEANERDW
jgi:transcription initiation factor TFIIIB Brf1 subunit/transcription initiation factor TFIIB